MKVIIPAAGIGKRLRPYTHTKPKPMVNVAGKTIIGHILEALKGHVSEVVLIVGYQKEKLIESVTRNFADDFKFTFVEQKKRMGLGHAIYVALEDAGSDEEVLINLGDEIFGIDYGDLLKHYHNYPDLAGVLGTKEVDKPQHYGIVEQKDGVITRLVEKPQNPTTNTAIAGIYLIRKSQLLHDILHEMITSEKKGKGGEFQLTDALQEMIERDEKFTIYNIEEWYDCGRPEMLLDVNRILLERMESGERPTLENSVIIEPVVIGTDCQVKNSIIGPYVSLDNGTTVNDVRISDSIVGARCHLDCLILNKSIIDDDVIAKGKAYSLNAGQDSVIDLA
jgi:glucose-1-phosphate thymidylyltransferase